MKLQNLLLLCLCIIIAGCKNNSTKDREQSAQDATELYDDEMICCCPPTLYLQPFNDFTNKEAQYVKRKMKVFLKDATGVELDIEILPAKKLDDMCLNDAKTRYRGDKILNAYKDSANSHVIIIGMLHDDISVSYKGKADWGVLGYSYKCSNVGVASSYRVKNKRRDFWKVVAHEFIHAHFNYGHCLKNDDNCIIQDAKGHPNFSTKESLCDYCKNYTKI